MFGHPPVARICIAVAILWTSAPTFCVAQRPIRDLAEIDRGDVDSSMDAPSRDDVLDWIGQLDAGRRLTRDTAERKLIEAGPRWDRLLRRSLLPSDAPGGGGDNRPTELRQRLRRIQAAWSEQETSSSTADPMWISLADVATLGEALEAISRQSGIEFQHTAETNAAIVGLPGPFSFWHAVDYITDQCNLDVYFYGGDRQTIRLVSRATDRPSRVDSAAYGGDYRLEPTMVTSNRFLHDPKLSGLNVSVEIAWLPGRTPVGLKLPVDQIVATLDTGQTLRPQSSARTIEIATNPDVCSAEFFLPLQRPTDRPRRLNAVSGELTALMPGPIETFSLPLGEIGQPQTIDRMTVRIESMIPDGPLHKLRVRARFAQPVDGVDSHHQFLADNEVDVLMPDQTTRQPLGLEIAGHSPAGMTVVYLFDLDGNVADGRDFAGATMRYRSPTRLVPQQVAFVLRDIDLP